MRIPFSSLGALVALTLSLPAQWAEVGDAGDLPRTAQVPNLTIVSLPSISGTLASATDVDMYLIHIPDPAAFSATTVGGATFDTQLWLFHLDGRGVTSDDDTATPQSTIDGNFVPYAGTYYLAVSGYDIDPIASGAQMWNDTPFNTQRRPDGPHRGESVDAWTGTGFGSGAYTIALTGCTRPGKQVVVPDNHHLSASPGVFLSGGLSSWWRGATGGRFQVLYDASHFASAGMSGAWLDKILFRGEDGEPNLGGQQWANVQVRVARTTMTPATMGLDFAANLAAAVSVSPVANFPTVTVAPSTGSIPNNYCIELDLYHTIGGFFYDSTLGNLLVDVTMPTPATLPPSGPVILITSAAGSAAFIRGAGITTSAPAALTGTPSVNPPVMAFNIDGAGGASPPIPAIDEPYGSGCGGAPSTFYQSFVNGQPFDIWGLTLTPDNPGAPNFYQVTGGAGAFDPTKVNAVPNSIADDSTVLHQLGFPFNFPGGSTASIRPCTNGYVWLDGTSTTADFTPTVTELLGSLASSLPRLCLFWADLHAGVNTVSNPNSGLHVLTDTSGGPGNSVTYATWFDCGLFNSNTNGNSIVDMQLVIHQATQVVEFRYGRMPSHCQSAATGSTLVGFTRGRIGATPSVDPQSRDLSVEVPFVTLIEGAVGNIGQRIAATPDVGGAPYGGRAYAGQTLTFDALNVPAGTLIGVQLLDFVASRPGLNIPTIHPPGCGQATSLSPVLHQVTLFPVGTVLGTVPVLVPPGVEGFELFAQYASLDGLFGGPSLVTQLSNAVKVRVGKN